MLFLPSANTTPPTPPPLQFRLENSSKLHTNLNTTGSVLPTGQAALPHFHLWAPVKLQISAKLSSPLEQRQGFNRLSLSPQHT